MPIKSSVATAKPVLLKPKTVVAAATVKPKLNGSVASPAPDTSVTALVSGFEVKETMLDVQRRYAGGKNTSKTLEIRTFATRAASVSISAKQRLGSLGQGGEVSVMVTVPCYQEELDAAQTFASEKVTEYLALEQDRLVELAGPDASARDADNLPGDDEQVIEDSGEGDVTGDTVPLTASYIRELADEEEFAEFCASQDVSVSLSDFNDDLDAAKEGVIEYMLENNMLEDDPPEPEPEEETTEDETTEDADDGEEETTEEAASEDLYTESELVSMSMLQIAPIFKEWEINGGKMPGKVKGATERDHKNRCIKMILEFQAEATAG